VQINKPEVFTKNILGKRAGRAPLPIYICNTN
jgi:hypothetical protein